MATPQEGAPFSLPGPTALPQFGTSCCLCTCYHSTPPPPREKASGPAQGTALVLKAQSSGDGELWARTERGRQYSPHTTLNCDS